MKGTLVAIKSEWPIKPFPGASPHHGPEPPHIRRIKRSVHDQLNWMTRFDRVEGGSSQIDRDR